MSLASKLATLFGTGVAYGVHYMGKRPTSDATIGLIYANRKKIKELATKYALDKTATDAVQNNLLECL